MPRVALIPRGPACVIRRGAILLLLLAGAIPAVSHGGEPERTRIEVTPFVGYRLGGRVHDAATGTALDVDEAPSYGLTAGVSLDESNQVELLYRRQPTRLKGTGLFAGTPLFDVDVEYFHVGGAYVRNEGRVRPFVAGSLGATHLDPDGPGLDSETRFSLGLGGGVKVMATDRLGLRLEGRGFATVLPANTSVFCASGSGGGSCAIQVEGDVLLQFELGAGLVVVF